MSRLSQYYSHRKAIEDKAEKIPIHNIIEWEQLEERIFREETMPQILQAIEPILKEVESPLSININYSPHGSLVLNFTRNTLQKVMNIGSSLVESHSYCSDVKSQSLVNEGATVESKITKDEKKPVIDKEASRYNHPIKMQFYDFLCKKKAASTAKSYISNLDKIVRVFIRKFVDSKADSIFSYTTPEDVSMCISILKSSEAFKKENTIRHNSMTAALNQYLLFVQSFK